MPRIIKILLIEYSPENLNFYMQAIDGLFTQKIQPDVIIATSLEEASAAFKKHQFDILITNLYLPDSQGIDTFLELQKWTDPCPIIIIGNHDAIAQEAIKLGAQDYLPKIDCHAGLLSRVIRHAIERHRLHESLKALSFTDALTGVYNRRGFITLLEQQMSVTKRNKKGFCLFIADLDYLKKINDKYGHLSGDHALIAVTKSVLSAFRKQDLVGRIGGDEFGIVAINATQESSHSLKRGLQEKIQEFNALKQEPFQLSLSIGNAYFDGYRDLTLDELLQQADRNLYLAKNLAHSHQKN